MILLTLHEWIGPSRNAKVKTVERERYVGMVSERTIAEAVRTLREYERRYKARYSEVAVEFRVISISSIETIDEETRSMARLESIDQLLKLFEAAT